MSIERLESRRLMSVSLNPTSHLLTINGTAGNDVITAKVVGTTLKVTDNGKAYSFTSSKVTRLLVKNGAGADTLTLDPTVKAPATIYTGPEVPGSFADGDTIQGGSGNDTIYVQGYGDGVHGGSGNDTFYVSSGFTGVFGDGGNDKFVLSGDGATGENVFNGGTGTDTIDYSKYTSADDGLYIANGVAGVYFLDDQGLPQVDESAGYSELSGFENFTGTGGDDYLVGTAGANVLHGGRGNDVIDGKAGQDALFGDDGNDTLLARDGGPDFLAGGLGTDKAKKDSADNALGIEVLLP